MHSIRRSEEMDNSITSIDKLKAARVRKCNMIFDSLCPDQHDTIHLYDLDNHLRYLHPDSANSLWMFFQAFKSQTKKESMNRKYFTVNMFSALEKNKFNLHVLFQDAEIVELEKRVAHLQANYLNLSDQVKGRVNSAISNEGNTTESTQRADMPWQKMKENFQNHSPILTNRREYSFRSQTKVSEAKSLGEKENAFAAHESQRESQKKLQGYLKRHFDTELLDPLSQREISTSVIINNIEESQIIHAVSSTQKKSEVTPKKIPVQNHRSKSIPSTAEIELEKCTFEPKLYKPLKSVLRNEVQPKIYEFMLKNRFLNGMKADAECDTSFTKRQKTGLSPFRNAESFISGRSRPGNSLSDGLTNMSLINLGYADAHHRKMEYAQQHLIPEYVELKTRRKSLERQNTKQKPPKIARTNSSAGLTGKQKTPVKEVHLTIESLQEKPKNWNCSIIPSQVIDDSPNLTNINESLEVRKRYHAYMRNELKGPHLSSKTVHTLERSNSRLSTHESNKADNSFQYGGHYLPTQNFLYESGQKGQKLSETRENNNAEEKKKGRSLSGFQREAYTSFLGDKSMNNLGLQNSSQNTISRKNSKLDMPLKRSPAYHLKPEGPKKKGEQKDKENNYNFSFTDRDISQGQII